MFSLRQRTLTAVFSACLAAGASPSPGAGTTRPAGVRNPDYDRWAALKEGAWVRVRVSGASRDEEWTTRLTKVNDDEVRLEVTEARPGEKPGPARERRVPAARESKAEPDAADEPQKSGDETLAVADVELPCHWETRGEPGPGGPPSSGDTTWTCAGIPGFVERVSWLAPDPALGLPESKATERLVAFDLPPRKPPAPADGGARLPTHAGPPTRFSFTYKFDPPGWRHWSHPDEASWEEQWETGRVVKTRVVGWVDDGERLGTLVRRLDGTLETVIPDAGKGAWIWFRPLPAGNWTRLATIEESGTEPNDKKADEKADGVQSTTLPSSP